MQARLHAVPPHQAAVAVYGLSALHCQSLELLARLRYTNTLADTALAAAAVAAVGAPGGGTAGW